MAVVIPLVIFDCVQVTRCYPS